MTNILSRLEGKEFVLFSLPEQLNMRADDGTMLVIYNKHSLLSPEGLGVPLKEGVKVIVQAANCSEVEASITFDDGKTLIVDLSSEGYAAGPEAMQLISPTGPTVVWN